MRVHLGVGAVFLAAVGAIVVARPHEAATSHLVMTLAPSGNGPDSSSSVVAVPIGGVSRPERILSLGFHSARRPQVSRDGRRVVFAGRREAEEPWSLWETSIDGTRTRQIAPGLEATDPVYISDDRLVFSARSAAGDGWALYAVNRDGSRLERLTHHPGDDLGASVLRDGRVLFSHRREGEAGPRRLLTVRPDGTGLDFVYEVPAGATLWGRAVETESGSLVAVEVDATGVRRVVEIDPSGAHTIATAATGNINAIARAFEGVYVAYASTPETPSRVVPLGTDGALRGLIVERNGSDVLEAVLAVPRPAQPGLLSVVDTTQRTGWIYGIDARISDLPGNRGRQIARLRVSAMGGVWGEVNVQVDGSFFIELPADTPFRLETVDASGNTIRGPSSWLWVRPGEHRGCIGCHEPRHLAPPNRVPLAIEDSAVRLVARHGSEGR